MSTAKTEGKVRSWLPPSLKDMGELKHYAGWSLAIALLIAVGFVISIDRIPFRYLDRSAGRADPLKANEQLESMACLVPPGPPPPTQFQVPWIRSNKMPAAGGTTEYYLVTSRLAPFHVGFTPLSSGVPLDAAIAWAGKALGREGRGSEGIDGSRITSSGSIVPTPRGCPAAPSQGLLEVLPGSCVHPGVHVIAGPYDDEGTILPRRDLIAVTIAGLIEEPGWMDLLRYFRSSIMGVDPRELPFSKVAGFAGPGWILALLGRDWSSLDDRNRVEQYSSALHQLGTLLTPPLRSDPLVVSTTQLSHPDELLLRQDLNRKSLESGYVLTPSSLGKSSLDPLMLRSSVAGVRCQIWELSLTEITGWLERFNPRGRKVSLSALVTRGLNLGLHPNRLQVYLRSPELKVMVIHLPRSARVQTPTGAEPDVEGIMDAFAKIGFDLVVGVGTGLPGRVWTRGKSLIVSDLGQFSSAKDILSGQDELLDLGWTIQCSILDGVPFQCYHLPVISYLGEPEIFHQPMAVYGGTGCWWRGDSFLKLMGR